MGRKKLGEKNIEPSSLTQKNCANSLGSLVKVCNSLWDISDLKRMFNAKVLEK